LDLLERVVKQKRLFFRFSLGELRNRNTGRFSSTPSYSSYRWSS